MDKFFKELKRRKVFREAGAYLIVSWLLLEVFATVLPVVEAPDWLLKVIMLIMAIGFPIWLFISWVYEVTPEGFKKTSTINEDHSTAITNKRLSILILVALITAIGLSIFEPSSIILKPNANGKYSIAVLPFKDLSSEDTEWFCDGVTDKILHHLSPFKNLIVISNTSSSTYKGTDKKISKIMKELDVDYILEGSVTKHNDKVIITAQLINKNDEHIWSHKYSDSFDDIFAVQHDVSIEITKKLIETLSPEEEKALEKYPTDNLEAYYLFCKGRLINDSRKKEDLELNIELNKQAIVLDPNFAEAYAEIAHSYYLMGNWNYINDYENINKAKSYVEKSLKIKPNFRAYDVKAMLLWGKNFEEVKENFEKAIALNSNDAATHLQYGRYFALNPNPDLKNYLIQIRIAQQLDPFSNIVFYEFFYALLLNNKFKEAEEYLNKMSFVISKEQYLNRKSTINVVKNKDWTEAIRFFEKEIEKDSNNTILYRLLGFKYNDILNDDINYMKYTKKAYELDSTNSSNVSVYHNALVEGKKFKEAKKLMQSQNFKSVLSKKHKLNHLFYYYYQQEDYLKAQEVLKDSLMADQGFSMAITYAQLGDRKNAIKYCYYNIHKGFVHAILKEKDSMYYNLDRPSSHLSLGLENSRREFDPYRKEERFKALLRKHYFPITHWNE